nr:histone deacetylase complex subunit SAP18 isoform X2 [Nomia melanderi]
MTSAIESMVVDEKQLPEKPIDREKTCPLLLRVFCNTGRHHNIMEYSRGNVPSNELQIYTWMDATLREITGLVKEVNPDARSKGVTCSGQKGADDNKTLAQARFTIGDYLDISITPPNRQPAIRRGALRQY